MAELNLAVEVVVRTVYDEMSSATDCVVCFEPCMYPLLLKDVMICSASAHDCLPLADTTSDGENDADSDDVKDANREGDLSCEL